MILSNLEHTFFENLSFYLPQYTNQSLFEQFNQCLFGSNKTLFFYTQDVEQTSIRKKKFDT